MRSPAYLYRWVVTFSILYFLSQFLKPYKLQSLSYLIAGGSLVPLLFMPAYQGLKFFRQPGRMRKVKKVRAAVFAAVTVALVTGILLIPTPLRVQGTLVLTVAKPTEIYAEVPGVLKKLTSRTASSSSKGPSSRRSRTPRSSSNTSRWKSSKKDTRSRPSGSARFRSQQPGQREEEPSDGTADGRSPHEDRRSDRPPDHLRTSRRSGDRSASCLDDRAVPQVRTSRSSRSATLTSSKPT